MKFVSTRGKSPSLAFSQALLQGLAPDGGLYVPESFPHFELTEFSENDSLAQIGEVIFRAFLKDRPDFADEPLLAHAKSICERAFNFQIPLKLLANNTAVLELFHGPTAAFKDVGARFLAECILELPQAKPRTVLVATSGDTGGAVAAAFFQKPGIEVVILYPKDRVSPLQEKQLTAWGENIRAFSVRGDFDDCQRIVKEAFLDVPFQRAHSLVSSNSISIGRLLPQSFYFAQASLNYYRRTGGIKPGFIIPAGNLGNAMAAFWAKKMGFPIGQIILATNANQAIPQYFASAQWQPHATISTLANAMDVGNPSNMERLLWLYPNFADLKKTAASVSVSDQEISETIRHGSERWGEIWCPHTATAVFVRESQMTPHWIIVATAHPAKFEWIIEPLIGKKIEMPASLATLLKKTSQSSEMKASLPALKSALLKKN